MNNQWKELDKVVVSSSKKNEIFNQVVYRKKPSRKPSFRLAPLLLTSFAALLLAFNVFKLNLVETKASVGTVAVDTSSLIILEVNEKNQVTQVSSSLIEDEKRLQSLQLIGRNLDDALIVVVGEDAGSNSNVQDNLVVYLYSEDQEHMMRMDDLVQNAFMQMDNGGRHCMTRRMSQGEWENMMKDHDYNDSNGHRRRRMHE